MSNYPLHTNITATVFWLGEPQGGGSSEDNALTAFDDLALAHYTGYPSNKAALAAGVYDYPEWAKRDADTCFPVWPGGRTPQENPFYCDLPYNEFHDSGAPKKNRASVIPWAPSLFPLRPDQSAMKNRWLRISKGGITCYAQIEDCGPYVYNDVAYVFGSDDRRPRSKRAHNAGMDVSPAVAMYLRFNGENNDENRVDWQFVDDDAVPDGPWKRIVSTRGVTWV
jgi:hypothetical protein